MSSIAIILYLALLIFHLSIFLEAYEPVDRFSINCGSTGDNSNNTDSDRTWTGDINTNLFSPQDNQTVAARANTQSSSANQLVATARLSYFQFSYSFPVTAGPKFVRLFFYPSSYPGFNRPDALFTVKSGEFTLLKDFNASLNADAAQSDTIFKEYIINMDDAQRVNLTFTPSTSHLDSYAFINSIEVVSMPKYLYYTDPNDFIYHQITFVGYPRTPCSIESSTALETNYRIKVGSQTITPKNDTGMLRLWEGDDADYLGTPSALRGLSADLTGRRNITVNPDYVAPEELYRTLRDMGMNGDLNKKSNLTWEFPVDSGFFYMLRLHFCELDPNITDSSDRAFFIYIAGQLAEDHADVMKWSKQKGVAVHRDYVVMIQGSQKIKKVNLSLQMHPLPDSQTKYSDPFLNGLEIFKISDPGSNNLAGPNPDPITLPFTQIPSALKPNSLPNSNKRTALISVLAGFTLLSVVTLLSIVVFFLLRRGEPKNVNESSKSPFSFTKSTSALSASLPHDLCHSFSLVEMRAATKNFDELLLIGVGGFGNVYKGYIDDGATPVAIKRLKPGSKQGLDEFRTEIEMLSQLRHLHLVSLIGYCCESNEMILVYDFMARGTLHCHLYNTDKNNNPSLSWKQRLHICIGAARGLHYLHAGATHNIIHRDVKSTNILLDEKWVAKLSDFGLSKIGPTGISRTHLSTVVKGSLGYLDPEYYKRMRLTLKSDVYSFGVVLFEVLCGRPPLMRTPEKRQMSLAHWAKYCYDNGTLDQIVDPALKGQIAPECLKKFGETAVSCLLDDGSQRPTMNDIVWMLEFALQLQESADETEQNDHTSATEVTETIWGEDSDDSFSGKHSYGNKIVDPTLKGKIAPECWRKFGETAVSCLHEDGTQRPSMDEIVWSLEFALQLQETA